MSNGYFTTLIIFGKKEREKFEVINNEFSKYINDYYNISKIYHDGKWMFIDIKDDLYIEDIINMIKIKKNPNRKKEDLKDAVIGR